MFSFLTNCGKVDSPVPDAQNINNSNARIAQRTDILPATALQPYGRYRMNNTNNTQNLELISSAAHFGFTFEGTEVRLFASIPNTGGHNYLQYELDGVYQKKIKIVSNSTDPIILKARSGGRHTVWVYKATEAHTGPIFIEKITGKSVQTTLRPAAPIIEFIGNSITSGAASDPSEVPCGTGVYHDQHNALLAYGPRVAKAVGASFVVSSVSGIGIYRNWNSDGPAMPQVYEKIDFQDNNPERWNFSTFTPQVVSIALGTNDLSAGDGTTARAPFDKNIFIDEYVKFVQLIKSKYPNARIALLSSPIICCTDKEILESSLLEVKARIDGLYPAGKPVALHFITPMQVRGCLGHPSVGDQAVIAQELTPFFSGLLNQ
jgi:hypothetical protein